MNHKDLDVWKKAVDFVTFVYQVTQKFPDSEKFGLTSQLRRAAVSIAVTFPKALPEVLIKSLFSFSIFHLVHLPKSKPFLQYLIT